MTEHIQIKNVRPRVQYIGDGTQTVFPYAFGIFEDSDIEVYLNETLLEDGYTVTGAGSSTGGSIVFDTAPVADTQITILRNLSIERVSDFQDGGELRAKVLNHELDYQTACMQQIAEDLNRSMVLPKFASSVNMQLPTPEAGKAILWNADATALENSTIEINNMIQTLQDKIDEATTAATTATGKAADCLTHAGICTTKAAEAVESAEDAAEALAGVQTAIANTADVNGSNINAGTFVSNLGVSWLYSAENGSCLSLPYGHATDRLKIMVVRISSNANNFTWTFPIAFDYFYRVVSNCNLLLSSVDSLSSITVIDNNRGDTEKHSVIDLILVGV